MAGLLFAAGIAAGDGSGHEAAASHCQGVCPSGDYFPFSALFEITSSLISLSLSDIDMLKRYRVTARVKK